jgi:hypothetical protein
MFDFSSITFAKKKVAVSFGIYLLLTCSVASGNSQMDFVNFDGLKDISFRQIGDQISRQTKYTLLIDKSILDEKIIVGRYGDLPVDEFLSRIMKKKNHSIVYDNAENKIIISTFKSAKKDNFYKFESSVAILSGKIDPVTQEDYAAINDSLRRAQKNIFQRINDPDEIDPVSMQRYYEINLALEKSANINNQKELIDHVSGKSFEQINVALQNVTEKFKETDMIDQVSGQQYKIINKALDQSRETTQKKRLDPSSVDPISGRTYREINESLMK